MMQSPSSRPRRDFALAVEHHQAERLTEAEPLYRRVIAAEPRHAEAKRLLGVLLFQRGDPTGAEAALREAIAVDPHNAASYDYLAFVLHTLKRDDDGLSAMRRAVELAPDNAEYLANLGSLLIELRRTLEAIAALRRAVAASPDNMDLHHQFVAELLKAGEAKAAAADIDACIARGALSAGILAHQAIALTEIGDKERLQRLVDFEGLIVCRRIGEAHGCGSLADFNKALASRVDENSSLHEEATTVNGVDTANDFLDMQDPFVSGLRRFIVDQVEARLRDLPPLPHPFAASAPRQWRFGGSWAVKMWRQGHQVTHIHPKAWMSGVYYVRLPEIVQPGQQGHDGWIEFGRGPAELYAASVPEVRLIQPVEGMLITFPSYIWHRTIPFETKSDRISVAFDVVPMG